MFCLCLEPCPSQEAPSGRLPIMMPETEADSIPPGPESRPPWDGAVFGGFLFMCGSGRGRAKRCGAPMDFAFLAVICPLGERKDRGLHRRPAHKLQDLLQCSVGRGGGGLGALARKEPELHGGISFRTRSDVHVL